MVIIWLKMIAWWNSALISQINNCCTFFYDLCFKLMLCSSIDAWKAVREAKNLPPVLSTMKREKEVFFTFFAVVLISRKLYSIFHSTSHRQEGPYSKVCTHNTLTYTLFLTRKMEFAGYRNHFLDQDRSWYARASQYARPHCRMLALARAATPCRAIQRRAVSARPCRPLAPPSGRFGLIYCNLLQFWAFANF